MTAVLQQNQACIYVFKKQVDQESDEMERKIEPLPVPIYQPFQIKIIKEKQSDYLNVLEKKTKWSSLYIPLNKGLV